MIGIVLILSVLIAANSIVALLIAVRIYCKPSTVTGICTTFALNVFIGFICLFIGFHPDIVGHFKTYSAKAIDPRDTNVVVRANNGQTYHINNLDVDNTVRVATKQHKAGSTGYEITVPNEHTKELLGFLAPAPKLTEINYEKAN